MTRKSIYWLVIGTLVCSAWLDPTRGGETDEDGFVSLFDGRSFDGWHGVNEWFRIEDGQIVAGRLDRKIPRNEFLRTERRFGDFELRLQFKIEGENPNAGVQFRTEEIPDHHEVIGYQADIARDYNGCLYDESRRRKILDGPPAEERPGLLRPSGWNDYRIRCVGPRIELWLNGKKTVDYTEPDPEIPRTGIIALQVHSGAPMEARYRKLRIKEL